MNKIILIIKREYLTRVRKKTFLISTLLFPLLYVALVFGSGYLMAKGGDSTLQIALVDSSGYFDKGKIERENALDSSNTITYLTTNPDSLRKNFESLGYDGYIIVPANVKWEEGVKDLQLYTSRTLGLEGAGPVRRKMNSIWNTVKNEKLGLDESKLAVIKSSEVTIKTKNVNDETANSGVSTVIGFVSAIMMYFILMLYGSQVMMGVMEEKTSRIAEVIVSSVKPFQLMLGKIIGIGLVALTQVLIWIIFIFAIYNVTAASGEASSMDGIVGNIQQVFASTNIPLVLGCFLFYLMGGFLFYSSMFAAIGSAVNEDMREAQSLSFPLMMPIIFGIVTMQAVIKDPTGPLAVWGSIIPFTSPIYMMARLPFGVPGTVPIWQLIASMITLVLGFIFTTWFAGKIYRTGILMYGKKPSWKEMMKWAFRNK